MALIQVKPIDVKKWHGKKGQESFTRPKIIQALIDPVSVTYQTGLSPEEEKKLGEMLKVDLSNQYNMETPHPFWDSKMGEIRLENRTQFFNTENALDYVKVKVLKASKYVANSQKDYDNGDYPEATHIIFDESEEVDAKASHVDMKNKAIIEVSKLSKAKKIELVMILSANDDYLKARNLKGKSENFITIEIDKIVEKRPEDILRFIKMDKEYVSLYALVLECLQKNVLRKDGHKIMYLESVIAQDIKSAVDYLGMVENNEFKIRLEALVNE